MFITDLQTIDSFASRALKLGGRSGDCPYCSSHPFRQSRLPYTCVSDRARQRNQHAEQAMAIEKEAAKSPLVVGQFLARVLR
jgi:hypothetical protein